MAWMPRATPTASVPAHAARPTPDRHRRPRTAPGATHRPTRPSRQSPWSRPTRPSRKSPMRCTVSDVFADLVGQDEAVATLRRAADAADQVVRGGEASPGAMTHAWLFTGPAGSGRSVAARAFAAALQCANGGCGECQACHTTLAGTHADVRFVVPDGLTISVAEMRSLVLRAASSPTQGRWQVLLVEDADRLTEAAGNALLKAAEAEAVAATADRAEREKAEIKTALGAGGTGRGAAGATRGTQGQIKDLERRQKSRATRAQRDALDRALVDLAGFYRDVLMVRLAAPVTLVHEDVSEVSRAAADKWTPEATLRRIEAVLDCREAIEANVKPKIAVESMMLTLWHA